MSSNAARARVDLPDPDSPTTPNASPARRSRLTSSTARSIAGRANQPRGTGNCTLNREIDSATGVTAPDSGGPREAANPAAGSTERANDSANAGESPVEPTFAANVAAPPAVRAPSPNATARNNPCVY